MDEANRTGLPCLVALLGRHAQVDMHVFTQECLHPRMSSPENVFTREYLHPRMADASVVSPYFILCAQLDTAVHVLANCTWLRLLTES